VASSSLSANTTDLREPPAPLSRWRAARKWIAAQEGWVFIFPWVVGFILLDLGPYIFALIISFLNWDVGRPPTYIGLRNYQAAFTDPLVGKSLWNTAYYTLFHVPGSTIIAFAVAGLLNQRVRGMPIWRTMYYIPSVTSGVGMALIWIWLFAPRGALNGMLGWFGIEGPRWLTSTTWAMPALIIMSNWKGIGYAMLIFLAGLQGVPAELYEAAVMDGANSWYRLVKITIPMLSPTTFFVLTTSFIGAFQGFDQFYIMTNGGPSFATTTLVLHIFNNGFRYFKMGYASSMAFVLFLCILFITLIQWTSAKTWVHGFTQD
jgi:multiple sugar transport system permease protein